MKTVRVCGSPAHIHTALCVASVVVLLTQVLAMLLNLIIPTEPVTNLIEIVSEVLKAVYLLVVFVIVFRIRQQVLADPEAGKS